MSSEISASSRPAQVVFYNDPKFRSIAYQLILCAVVAFLVYGAARNAIDNLARAHIASGFGFWNDTAGFDISQTLIEYTARGSTYGRAFWVGLLNTLLVAGLGIIFATILGFVIGISRLSSNWLLAKVAGLLFGNIVKQRIAEALAEPVIERCLDEFDAALRFALALLIGRFAKPGSSLMEI